MSLTAFVGELGSGKTLCLTFMGFRNWMKGKDIYSNYKLNFPRLGLGNEITYIRTINDIIKIKQGFACLDELWLWLDSRSSHSKKNKIISMILTASRKRGYDIGYTTQNLHQIDKRIRDITDFIASPKLSANNRFCRLYFFKNGTFRLIKEYKFKTKKVFQMYDTHEVIRRI